MACGQQTCGLVMIRKKGNTNDELSKRKKGKRKVQGVPQSQTAALSRHQEEEEAKPNKHKSNKRTKNTKTSSLLLKRGNRNVKKTENTRTKCKT